MKVMRKLDFFPYHLFLSAPGFFPVAADRYICLTEIVPRVFVPGVYTLFGIVCRPGLSLKNNPFSEF